MRSHATHEQMLQFPGIPLPPNLFFPLRTSETTVAIQLFWISTANR